MIRINKKDISDEELGELIREAAQRRNVPEYLKDTQALAKRLREEAERRILDGVPLPDPIELERDLQAMFEEPSVTPSSLTSNSSSRRGGFRFGRNTRRNSLLLETLADRVVPAITILVNYSMEVVAPGSPNFLSGIRNEIAEEMGLGISNDIIDSLSASVWSSNMETPGAQISSFIVSISVSPSSGPTLTLYMGVCEGFSFAIRWPL